MLDWENPLNTTPVTAPKAEVIQPILQTPAPQPRELSQEAASVSDKRVVNGTGNINQLAPYKYPWAWDFYLAANRNHWTPLDISMNADVYDYHHKLTDEERHLFVNVLAYLTTSDILAMRNVAVAVMEKMTAPELQLFQGRQVFDETLHQWTYQHCIETIGLDQNDVYNRYRTVSAIRGKINYSNKMLDAACRLSADLSNRDDLEQFALSYLFFAAVFEGTWFYHGFSPIFALQRRGLMRGTGEQFQYILRDECLLPDHEVLTPQGWVRFDELDNQTPVLQYHEVDGSSFVMPSRLVDMEYSGTMYHFANETKTYDLVATPHHRIVTLTKNNELRIVEAQDCICHPYMHMLVAHGKTTTNRGTLTIQERIGIAYQADGRVPRERCDGSVAGHITGKISILKERKIKRLTSLLQESGYTWKVVDEKREGYKKFIINFPMPDVKYMSKDLEWLDLSTVTIETAKEIIEEVAEWDGCRPSPWRVRYDNTNLKAVDKLQAVATIAGYRVLKKVIVDNRKDTYSDIHRLYIIKVRNKVQGGCITKREVQYTGKVYCVTVDSGMFYVRRNGTVMITGNCIHASFGIRTVRQLLLEENVSLDPSKLQDMWETAHSAEAAYINYIVPNPILGYNAEDHMEQFRFIANRRARQLGLAEPFPGAKNALEWLDEQSNIRKEKNFFETRVTEYQTAGSLKWD